MNKVVDFRIAIIGLGYVGLPLAVEFAKKTKTFGFDISESRINELTQGYDRTLEVGDDQLHAVLADRHQAKGLVCTNSLGEIKECNFFIVTVPTPVDKNNRPDLTPLYKASETVGRVFKKGDIVVY
jgi:UDP-N-acetyl-D-galactosamine dehydrogenase